MLEDGELDLLEHGAAPRLPLLELSGMKDVEAVFPRGLRESGLGGAAENHLC